MAQTTTVSEVPFTASFQSIASDYSGDSVILYLGFDGGNHGRVKKYYYSHRGIIEVSQFFLPEEFIHPNEIQIFKDTLVVTGYDQSNISTIGFFDKNTGHQIKIEKRFISESAWLQSIYFYRDTLYQCLYNGENLTVQKLIGNQFSTVAKNLRPNVFDYINQPIQGSKIFGDDLFVLCSYPTRIDIYNASDFKYKCSYFGEYNFHSELPESEGIAIVEYLDDIHIFYGLRPPNRINSLPLKNMIHECESYQLGDGITISDVLVKQLNNPYTINDILKLKVLNQSKISIDLYNNIGIRIQSIDESVLPPGDYEFRLNMPTSTNQFYFLVIRSSINLQTFRIVFKT